MAVTIKASIDDKKLARDLKKIGGDAAKAVDYTMRTMRRRAPVIVARNTAEVYNVAQYRLNPNNKRASGSVSMYGGMSSFTMVYRGVRLLATDFKGVKPKSIGRPRKRPYIIQGQIVQGQTAKLGHWAPPGSEGGRYSANSPWMLVPGVPGPVMRIGDRLGGVMRALSVPQMVVSVRHDEKTIGEIRDKMSEELSRQLARFGIS